MNNTLRMVLGAIITLALAWVILSLILQWARPALYNTNGSVNWWTTLWVTLATVFILWIVLFILYYLTDNRNECCDPSEYANSVAYQNNGSGYNNQATTTATYNNATTTAYNPTTTSNPSYNSPPAGYNNSWSLW